MTDTPDRADPVEPIRVRPAYDWLDCDCPRVRTTGLIAHRDDCAVGRAWAKRQGEDIPRDATPDRADPDVTDDVTIATPDRADLRARIEAAVAEAERARIRALGPEFRRVITNAYYDTRNEGGTMETAADRAVAAVLAAIDGPASAEPGPDGETK